VNNLPKVATQWNSGAGIEPGSPSSNSKRANHKVTEPHVLSLVHCAMLCACLSACVAVFLFCWLPFFTVNIINAVCIRHDVCDDQTDSCSTAFCRIDPLVLSCFVL